MERDARNRGRWIEVARVEDLRPGEGRTVVAEGRRLALFNDGGDFFAIDDVCPHQGASLGAGSLYAGRVVCPLHAWVFELRTGRCPRDSHPGVATYSVRRNGSAIEVELPDPAASRGLSS